MDDPDPTTATSLDELAACLRHVHLLADKPTYRALEQQTAREGGFLPGTRLRRARLARTAVSDMLLGRKFPGKAFLLTFVDACGVDLENDLRWEQAWNRLAVQYRQAPALPGEAEELRQENDELRRQLTAANRQAETAESRAGQEQPQAQLAGPLQRELDGLRPQLTEAEHLAGAAENHANDDVAVSRVRPEIPIVRVGGDELLFCTMSELSQQTAQIMSKIEKTGNPAFITRHSRFIAIITPLAPGQVESILAEMARKMISKRKGV